MIAQGKGIIIPINDEDQSKFPYSELGVCQFKIEKCLKGERGFPLIIPPLHFTFNLAAALQIAKNSVTGLPSFCQVSHVMAREGFHIHI